MVTGHSRYTGKTQVKRSHAGQAASAPRKKRRKRLKVLGRRNYAQDRQNKVRCTITVRGCDSWSEVFAKETVSPRKGAERFFNKWFGTQAPRELDYYRVESDMNCVSFERTVVSRLLSLGFVLEELEVEFDSLDRAGWGRCVWYKQHPKYAEPLDKMFRGLDPSLLRAMWKTEKAGDAAFGLYSMQMVGNALVGQPVHILLHKTLIFHKVVLSPPKQVLAKAA